MQSSWGSAEPVGSEETNEFLCVWREGKTLSEMQDLVSDLKICFLLFCETVFLLEPQLSRNLACRPGWPWTHRDLPASASWVLGLKALLLFLLFYSYGTHTAESLVALYGFHCRFGKNPNIQQRGMGENPRTYILLSLNFRMFSGIYIQNYWHGNWPIIVESAQAD